MICNETKIVDFDKYCNICKHKELVETEDPCNECLTSPTNVDSRRPIMYVKK